MNARCLFCRRVKPSGGILLCVHCAPHGDFRQHATVRTHAVIATTGIFGKIPSPSPPEDPVWSRVKVFVKRGGEDRLKAIQRRGEWNNDREAHETRDWIADLDADYSFEHWKNSRTGRTTHWKQGRVKDPASHGPNTHYPTTPAHRGDL